MPKVDFGLAKKTTPSPSTVERESVYFYSPLPSTSFVLPMPWDRRFSLGNPVKHWLITSKQEEIDYIRENFSPTAVLSMGRDASSVIIYEKTKEEYDAYLGLGAINQEEHNPDLEEAKKQAMISAGYNPAEELPPSPELKPEHTPVFDYKGTPHPTLEQRLAQTEMIAKATEALQKE